MSRIRSPNRDKAYQIYKEKGGNITNKELAELLNESEKTISSWKNRDKWNAVNDKKDCSNKENTAKKRGGQKGNQNAKGNNGGAPLSNENNLKHGIYKKLLYSSLSDDEKELLNLNELNEIEELKLTINLCDIQIARFMRLIKEATEKGNLVLKSVNNSNSKDEKGSLIGSVTTTSTINTNELIIRYNSEIEKIKKQKIKCLETLMKIDTDNSNTDENSITIKIGEDDF